MSVHFKKISLLIALLTLTLGSGCGAGDKSSLPNETGTTQEVPSGAKDTGPSDSGSAVVNRVEKSGDLTYKIYLQPVANATNRKGLILFGSGNDPGNPQIGGLDDGLQNNTANELAKLGYVAAIVAYRKHDPKGDWNERSNLLAQDIMQVAKTIFTNYGEGQISEKQVITGGSSYATAMLLTNIAYYPTLANTRGVLAACGALGKGEAEKFQVPVYVLACNGNADELVGEVFGAAILESMGENDKKNDSGEFIDPNCTGHCGGDMNTWTAKLVERVRVWLP